MKEEVTVAFYTLGCKVSQYETEALREGFLDAGFTPVPFDSVADVYVINTCTVTAESDAKSRKTVRRAIRKNPRAVVLVMGCYSQSSPKELAAIDGVSYISGNADKMKLPAVARQLLAERAAGTRATYIAVSDIQKEPFEPMSIREAPRTRAYIKIEDGCECRCTYCAIPAARGRVRSKPPRDVIREVEVLAKNGTREVVLTGIETASYGADFPDKYRLIDLLLDLERETSIERIRLGSLTPELLREDFVTRVAALKRLTPHVHLSIQSGSTRVLNAMRRRYNRDQALLGIHRLRAALPRLQLTADIIVGFPGESEEDFLDTLSFAEEAGFLQIHVFSYSKRKGTPAADFPDQVPEHEKASRSQRLSALSHRLQSDIFSRLIQEKAPMPVLFETESDGYFVGHSDTYIEVKVKTDAALHGELRMVTPIAFENSALIGEL